jgi:galactonate dehydratase
MMKRRHFLGLGLTGAAGLSLNRLLADVPSITHHYEEAQPLNLRVTDLQTFVVDAANDENFVYVKVFTNQGLVGLGEGTLTGKALTVEAAIQEHKRYLVGKDPSEIERHWQRMFRGPRYRGGSVMMSAISAVDIALWDILGQALGQPIWRLRGGKARDRVWVYPHELSGNRLMHHHMPPGTPEPEDLSYPELYLRRQEEGWTACKAGFLEIVDNTVEPSKMIRSGIERLKAVREAVGPDFSIMIDLHGKPTTPMAIEFCRRSEEYSPLWIEEATQLEDLDELALLRSQTSVPLATGERHLTKFQFSEMCARHLVNYVNPDVVHCGGITEMRKIAALAEAFRIDLSPHNPQSEVSTMASLHVCMATANAVILEIGSGQTPFFKDMFFGGGVVFKDGFALPPERPGLGLDLDEAIAAKFPYRPKDWGAHEWPDGSVGDR